jgi:Cysteine-rich CPCC
VGNNGIKTHMKCQCDCCDYFTLDTKGHWEICPVCFWEDEAWGLNKPDHESGANHGLTLRQARENFARLGASSARWLQHVLPAEARGRFPQAARTL